MYLLILNHLLAVLPDIVGRAHTLENQKLKVAIFYDSLGVIPPGHNTSSPAAWIPSQIEITDVPNKVLIKLIAFSSPVGG